jgi:putative PIN family toxin of toxin-antitoxin system
MLVVLDTNVLIAALISASGPPDRIYRAWRAGRFQLVTSAEQLAEIRRVSRYPKLKSILPAHRVGAMINNLQRAIVLESLPALPPTIHLADPVDAFLAAMSVASQADYLVTGDRRAGLLQLRKIGRTRILTPSAFAAEGI